MRQRKINVLIGTLFAISGASASANDLPNLQLNLEKVTVSGLSSGGYMAVQYHLANSDWVKGIGVIGSGPYYCAQGDIGIALSQCVSKVEGEIPLALLADKATEYESNKQIPELSNLADSKVWILHGKLDTRVIEPVSNALFSQYQNWVNDENIGYVNDKLFAHHFPTLSEGSDCTTSEAPFIGNCNYDAAGELLKHLYGDLNDKSTTASGTLHTFNQQKLGGESAETLADNGYVYVPEQCTTDACDLHISFHGCNQYAGAIGKAYASKTGLNEWADTNNMVVLYPQTKKSLFMPLNPQGCWDWWGYTDEKYATKDAEQISAITNMVNSLNQTQ